MKLTIFFLALLISPLAFTQNSQIAYLTLADSLYKHQNYHQAAIYFQKAIKDARHPGDVMLKLARSYSETNEIKEAGSWYEKAKGNNAAFSIEDSYHYAKTLISLGQRREAENTLVELLKKDPHAAYARQLLNDLQDTGKYYKDSLGYQIAPLSFNTAEAELAPAYYKGGIVFSSSQPEFVLKKKYHWDNTAFLKLYYSPRIASQNFQKPVDFDKDINTRFHDGPVVFYAKEQKMILNRNQEAKLDPKTGIRISHLSLFDVNRDAENKKWVFTPFPFNEPPYSFAHPSITEDGNTLYFISDRPGGYGGTDIYRSVRVFGQWSPPFNVGPNINTSENEVFPFLINNTLYFASDGRGGLGGLDIFKSEKLTNGFSPAVNLGYPINSPYDDFAFITQDQQTGFFSSARKGNDDIFQFTKAPDDVKIIARVFDGVTNESLSGASIQLMTMSSHDTTLISGVGGNFQFELPRETAYILIANKDGKVGMYSSLAVSEEDYQHKVHQVPAFGDTTRVACIGKIENEHGFDQAASIVTLLDETIGKETTLAKDQSLVSFMGEKGHRYKIKIQNERGDTVTHKLEIKPEDTGSKTWSMVLKEAPTTMTLAARVFNAETNAPLGGASVKVTTFTDPDIELTADEKGVVEFTLPINAAFLVVGSKDGLTGMYSGSAETGMDKNSTVHPVAAKGDPLNPVPVVALVSNSNGEVLDGAKATITDKATGEAIHSEINNGVLNFFGERNKSYNVTIEHDGQQSALQEVVISKDATAEKISLVMEEIKPVTHTMAVRVIKETDQSPMAGAMVKIMNMQDADVVLISDSEGLAEFTMPDGMAYIVVADKDGFTGMHMGVAENGADKKSIVHPVLMNNDPASSLQIFGVVKDESGMPITNAKVEIIDTKTGEKIPAKIENGILTFHAKRGEQYKVIISADGYGTREESIPISPTASIVEPLVLNLTKKLPVTINVAADDKKVISAATVVVTDKVTGEKTQAVVKDGAVTFMGEQGKQYAITVDHQDYQPIAEELIIPQKAQSVAPLSVAMVSKTATSLPTTGQQKVEAVSYTIAARAFKQSDNTPLANADATIMTFDTDDFEQKTNAEGITEFTLKEGAPYMIVVNKDGYTGMHSGMAEKGMDKASIIHPIPTHKDQENQVPVVSLISDESGKPVTQAQAEVTNAQGQKIQSTLENGILSFNGKKGEAYKVAVTTAASGKIIKNVTVDPTASPVQQLDIKLEKPVAKLAMPVAKVTTYILAARAFKESDNSPLGGASITIMSFDAPDVEQVANAEGLTEFTLKEGTPYMIVANKEGYTGMRSGIAEKGMDKAHIVHPIPTHKDQENQVPVVSLISDESGKPIAPGQVEVTNASGQKIQSTLENGILSFNGKKGEAYNVAVTTAASGKIIKNVTVDPTASPVQQLNIKLEKPEANIISKPEAISYTLAARAFKESDNTPLAGAEITIMSFDAADVEQVANAEGLTEFTLKEGTPYMIVANKDGYTGMRSGIAEKGMDKAHIIHPIPTHKDQENQVSVVSLIADESGKPMTQAQAEVTSASGEKIQSTLENGILSFNGKKGEAYTVAVTAEDHKEITKTVTVASTATTVQQLDLTLPTEKKIISYVMSARAFKEVDETPLAGASMKVMSFTESDLDLVADTNGVSEFTLPEDAPFIIIASKDGYTGMYSGVAEKGMDKNSIIHPIPTRNDPTSSVPVVSTIADASGKPVTFAQAIVTDITTGEKVEATIENGILAFDGKKGGAYKVTVIADGHEEKVRMVNIEPNASAVQQLEIKLDAVKVVTYEMAARAFKASDDSPLAGAEIKIISFNADDLDQVANADGLTEFTLPEGTPYMIIANKDGYTGMRSGIAEKGMDKNSIIHPIPTHNDIDKQLPVVSLIADQSGKPMLNAQAEVVDNGTGEKVESKIENGILSFSGKKGGDYKIEITDEDHEKQIENIRIAKYAATVEPLEISMARKKILSLPESSNLIILNNETPKIYVASDEIYDEIIEQGGMLYLQTKEETKLIGKGTLANLVEDPSKVIQLTRDQIVSLQNIYFDFNSAALDETDKQELSKVNTLIHRYPHMQLTVNAHADLRGSDQYNIALTKKRARAIKTYLVKEGVSSRNLKTSAFGKSAPVVRCNTEECTEQQHQKNRRAEFTLTPFQKAETTPLAVVKPQPTEQKSNARTRISKNYSKALAQYGDRKQEDLLFKICVGAYRLNPDLTFSELADLGTIERIVKGGINYYYLCEFASLRDAESVRQQVIQRGIPDAYVSIFYKGDKIPFDKFTAVGN